MIFVEIPDPRPESNMRIWRAMYGGCTFVIVHDPNEEVGYTATYRTSVGFQRPPRRDGTLGNDIMQVPGGPWRTKKEAEDACLLCANGILL